MDGLAASFTDPGWLAWWLGYLFIFYGILNNEFNLKQSRVVLVVVLPCRHFVWVTHPYLFITYVLCSCVLKKSLHILAIVPFFFAVVFVLALLYGVPENFYYDLIDLDRNPRLNDANLIISPIFEDGRQFVWFWRGYTLYFKRNTRMEKFHHFKCFFAQCFP